MGGQTEGRDRRNAETTDKQTRYTQRDTRGGTGFSAVPEWA